MFVCPTPIGAPTDANTIKRDGQRYQFPLLQQKSGCPTARYVGGTSVCLCECANPYTCLGVSEAADKWYKGDIQRYMAWARSPVSPGGDRDWTEKYDARPGDLGDGTLASELFLYNALQRVKLRDRFGAYSMPDLKKGCEPQPFIDEHRFDWARQVREHLAF